MCSLLLVCTGLRTLHIVKHILSEEECRRVGEAGLWWNELAVVIAVKPLSVVQDTLDVLEEHKGEVLAVIAAQGIESKFCST